MLKKIIFTFFISIFSFITYANNNLTKSHPPLKDTDIIGMWSWTSADNEIIDRDCPLLRKHTQYSELKKCVINNNKFSQSLFIDNVPNNDWWKLIWGNKKVNVERYDKCPNGLFLINGYCQKEITPPTPTDPEFKVFLKSTIQ